MKRITIMFMSFMWMAGCASMRQAQTNMGQSIDGAVEQKFQWGEVYCGQGTVCGEIEVKRVDFENRDKGRVTVTLHNRTSFDLQVQIAIEIVNDEGARLDQTDFQSIGVPAYQERSWSMPGVYQKGAKIRVVLRKV